MTSLHRSKSSPLENSQADYRIVVVGDNSSGKSSLINQFVNARFTEDYDPAVSAALRKQCTIEDQNVILEILDSASQSDDTNGLESMIQKGDGFLIVFSVNSRQSFEKIERYQQMILRVKDADTFPILLVGNKSDLETERKITSSDGKELAKSIGCRYLETSAKARHNVEEVFFGIVREVMKDRSAKLSGHSFISSSDQRSTTLSNAPSSSKKDEKCLIM